MQVIAAFPYSLAFSADTVEVRSPINGSLLQTLNLPKLNLIASKEDIFFTTTKVVSLIIGTLFSEEMDLAKEFFFNWGKFPLLCFEI